MAKIKLNEQMQLDYLSKEIEDIKELNIFINGLGIKVLGIKATRYDIPEQEYQYGDAWLIGNGDPYRLYVWTRKEIGSDWVDIGPLAIAGPQGPKGEKGDKGEDGTNVKWYTGAAEPLSGNYGDIWLNTSTGDIYFRATSPGGLRWNYSGNIKGPQGNQGPQGLQGPQGEKGDKGDKGDTGDVGGFINIAGILASSQMLPDPMDLKDLTKAFLVGPNPQAYSLYIQVGSNAAEAYWQNMGPLNVATYVSVNGIFQNTWDADTKLDKKSNDSYQYAQIYAVGRAPQNNAETIPAVDSVVNNSVVRRNSSGDFYVKIPSELYHPANKKYVDDAIAEAGGGTSYSYISENTNTKILALGSHDAAVAEEVSVAATDTSGEKIALIEANIGVSNNATKSYITFEADQINLVSDEILINHAYEIASKDYVANQIQSALGNIETLLAAL